MSACGGDDEDASTPSSGSTETETLATAPTDTARTETEPDEGGGGSGSGGGAEAPGGDESGSDAGSGSGGGAEAPSGGESGSGGAGDEEPARTLALFTARGGRIAPRVIRVPAFISIRLELRSADGGMYGLRFGDTTIETGGELGSHSTTIDGLRPGKAIVGTPTGAGNPVRVEATAEPGP